MKKTLFLLYLVAFALKLSAQSTLHTLPQWKYLYELNEQEVIEYRNNKLEPDSVLGRKTPIDSISLSQNAYAYLKAKRSFGYFMQVHFDLAGPTVSMLHMSDVVLKAYRFEDNWQIFLYDSSGFISDYTLDIDGRDYQSEAHCKCIEIEKKKLPKGSYSLHYPGGFIVINQNDFAAGNRNPGQTVRRTRRRFFDFLKPDRSPFEAGFIVLNQTEFRHGDSLHAKAFLMDRKGRPSTGEVTANIFSNYSGYHYASYVPAKQLSDGAYGVDWLVPDSIRLDQTYTITFNHAGNSRRSSSKSINFKVTHYDFVNYKIFIRQSDPYLLPKDSTYLIITATDQNDIPLPGSKVDLHFNIDNTSLLHVPYLSLHDSIHRNFFDTTIFLEPEKETWFKVPQLLLPYIDHTLSAQVKVTTPNNDVLERSFNFSAIQQYSYYTQHWDGDDLILAYILNRSSTTSDSVSIQLTDRFYSETQSYKTRLPHTIKNANRYSVCRVLDSLNQVKLSISDNRNMLSMTGEKTRDSFYLKFNNGQRYGINWTLYRKGKELLHGTQDSIAIPLSGTEPVQVAYRYLQGAAMYYQQETVIPATQALRIVHNLPEIGYPGQKIIAEMTVYDFDGKPVKSANITGVSINTQMPVIAPPNIPYFPKLQGRSLKMSTVNFAFPGVAQKFYPASDTAMYRRLALNQYLHYRLYYAPNGIHTEKRANENGRTELQVVLLEAGQYHMPREIWVDDEIRFLILGSQSQRPLIQLSSGWHSLHIRSKKYMMHIDSIWIEAGHTTTLGINDLNLAENTRIRYEEVSEFYEDQEIEKLEEHALLLQLIGLKSPSWVRQDSNYYEVQAVNYYGPYKNRHANYSAIAPIKEGMIEWFNRDTLVRFYFNPSMLYTLDSGRIKSQMKVNIMLASAKNAQTVSYYFSANALNYPELLERWRIEDSIAAAKEERKHIPQRPQLQYGQFSEYFGNGGTAKLDIQDGAKQIPKNFCWLENLNEPQYSFYVSRDSYYYSALKPGVYRLVTGTYEEEMYEVDSLVIDSLHHVHIRLDLLAKPLNPDHWAAMRYRYFQTMQEYGGAKVPIYEAYSLKQESKSIRKKGEVNGTALMNLSPAAYAYVLFLHTNGQDRYLSVANNQGHFQMYDMEAGTYWVQIISANRQVFFANEVTLSNGRLLSLQLDCITDTSLIKKISPSILSLKFNKDSATYRNIEGGFANMEGRIYDWATQLPLMNAQVRIKLNGIVIGGAKTDQNGFYSICCIREGKYSIEVIQSGYQNAIMQELCLEKGKVLGYNFGLHQSEYARWAFGDAEIFSNGNVNEYSVIKEETVHMAAPSSAFYDVQQVEVSGGKKLRAVALQTLPNKRKDVVEVVEDAINEKARLDEITANPSANKIRKDFKTNAFWVPNLITNKQGKTAFTYTLPDDQTQWINFLVAINKKQQTNLNTSYTRSYKPLSASLRVPEFVVVGDKITVSGTIRNLTGDSIQIEIRETLNSIENAQQNTVGAYLRQEKQLEIKAGKDTLTLSYTLKYTTYFDGEQRDIRVLTNKVYDRKVQSRILNSDEKTNISFNPLAVRKSIRLKSGLRDLLEEEISRLKTYAYGCTEQSASKLYALLREQQLRKALGESFTEQKEIGFLIKRLEDFQNSDGSWGWWKGSSGDQSLTLYVTNALILADEQGYRVKQAKRGAGNLVNQYAQMAPPMKLATLELAHRLSMKFEYEKELELLGKKNLSLQGQLNLISMQMAIEQPYDLAPILKSLKSDGQGNYYMEGESSWGFNAHVVSLSMQAYTLLHKSGKYQDYQEGLKRFVFNKLGYVQRNTFERAAIINALMDEVIAEGKGIFNVKLDNKIVSSPGTYTITENSIGIQNLGAGISVIAVEEYESDALTSQSHGIRLGSGFNVTRGDSLHVRAGNIVPLRVTAQVSTYQKYLVLNVPIPAGCQIISKPAAGYNETAREYFADHVVIYFEALPRGNYTFEFLLLPQFTGDLTLMPAMMEQMYEPEFFGREAKKRVRVD